jgi:hypothetical protein
MAKELTEEEKKKALSKTLSLTNPQDRNQHVITANDISDYDNMSDYERGLALAKYDADVDARNNFNYEASGPQIQPPIRESKPFRGKPSRKDLAQHDFELDAKNNFNYEAVNDKPRESKLNSLKYYYDSIRTPASETTSDSNITVAQPGSKDDTTLQSFSNTSTVSDDLGKLYSNYDPSKNNLLSNYFTGNAAREYLDRTEQIDVNPRPKVVNALDPFTERINGPREEKAKQVKAYAVSLLGREDKNKTFNSLKEAQDYFKAQGGKGAIATFKGKTTKDGEYIEPQGKADEFAYGKKREALEKQARNKENQSAAQAKLDEGFKASGGRSMWDDMVDARNKENAANRSKFEKFKEGVSEKDDALVAYNQFNKSQGILSKAYNKALSNGDYGAAINLQQIMQQRGAKIPTEMGARQEYFKKLIPERKQLSIELETEKRKQDAYLLSQLEQNRLANQKYNESRNASNPDAQFNNYSNANPFNEKYRLF